MARNKAYRRAEQEIEKARRSRAKKLDLSLSWGTKDSDKLTELPEALGQLTQLQSLDLSSNHLTALPEWLGQLTQLQSLDLSNNQLTALPESLGQLTQLQSLNLSSNQLTALPESVGRLSNLDDLVFEYGKCTKLPESFSHLKQLRQFIFTCNPVVEFPTALRGVTSLRTLSLYNNRLTSVPEWIEELQLLEKLELDGNQLTEVPQSMGNLPRLIDLDLGSPLTGGNEITDLPPSLARLNLRTLGLEANPLNPELASAYKEGLDAVKRYLRAKAEAQVVLNEAKLILVGEGEVGKSCLLGALRGDAWEADRPTTHGIEIKSVKVTDPATETEITLNGWDFGGQRVYRPTHQLFFSAPRYLSRGLETTRRSTARIREGVDQAGEAPRAGGQDPRRRHPWRPQGTSARY